MSFEFILIILAFIVGVFLIFKLIKKLVFAILTFILLIVLFVAGVGAVVYMDMNYLASQKDFNVNLVLNDVDTYEIGVDIPVINQEVAVKQVSSLENLDKLDLKSLEDEDNIIGVVLEKETYLSLIKGQEFDFSEVIPTESLGDLGEFNLKLTSEQVVQILDSNTPDNLFVSILFENNNIPKVLETMGKPIVSKALEEGLKAQGLGIKEVVFMLSLKESLNNQDSILTLLQAFKDETFNVYPDRFTFSLVRMLPVEMIQEYIPENLISSSN